MNQSGPLTGRRIVVVGGSTGIGLATALLALNAGAIVTIISRDSARLAEAARQDRRLNTVRADIRLAEEIQAAFSSSVSVDHVLVSAGTVVGAPVLSASMAELEAAFDERVRGVLHVVRAAAPHMQSGSFTFITGDLVDRPVTGLAAVAAAAAAVESLAKTLALELAPIRFNDVSPGGIDTPLYTKIFGSKRETAITAQVDRSPLRRMGASKDVAAAVLMLMSNPHASGAVLHIDGALRYT